MQIKAFKVFCYFWILMYLIRYLLGWILLILWCCPCFFTAYCRTILAWIILSSGTKSKWMEVKLISSGCLSLRPIFSWLWMGISSIWQWFIGDKVNTTQLYSSSILVLLNIWFKTYLRCSEFLSVELNLFRNETEKKVTILKSKAIFCIKKSYK